MGHWEPLQPFSVLSPKPVLLSLYISWFPRWLKSQGKPLSQELILLRLTEATTGKKWSGWANQEAASLWEMAKESKFHKVGQREKEWAQWGRWLEFSPIHQVRDGGTGGGASIISMHLKEDDEHWKSQHQNRQRNERVINASCDGSFWSPSIHQHPKQWHILSWANSLDGGSH